MVPAIKSSETSDMNDGSYYSIAMWENTYFGIEQLDADNHYVGIFLHNYVVTIHIILLYYILSLDF